MAFRMRQKFMAKAMRQAAATVTQRPTRLISQTYARRFLNLHEYRSKELLRRHGVRVQDGILATSPAEAKQAAIDLQKRGARDLIVKSQVLAGGRGKGHFNTGFQGGVQICDSPDKVEEVTGEMIGNYLITKQTDEQGQLVSSVLVHEGVDFTNEFYIAFLLERAYDGPCIVGSPMGGMDIEEVANTNPDKIKTIPIDIKEGLTKAQAKEMAEFVGFSECCFNDAVEQMQGLYNVFVKNDCVQVEINPVVQTIAEDDSKKKVYCLDAKLGFDDFAAFRNKEIFSWADPSMEDPREVAADEVGLNYVGLDGNIGCMVNGAGLAMATMDVIKLHGGEPANFLDVGGGADEKQVEQAFRILTADSHVKGILVNIFGGIMKCDVIARGVIAAAKTIDLQAMGIPLVVRLAGTNVDAAQKLLNESGLLIESANDLDDGAQKIVAAIAR